MQRSRVNGSLADLGGPTDLDRPVSFVPERQTLRTEFEFELPDRKSVV